MKDCKCVVVSTVCLMLLQTAGLAALELPPVLSSHMVLQRGVPVPVWGKAAPNETVTVEFHPSAGSGQGAQKKDTVADSKGNWILRLDPLAASADPGTMVISGAAEKKELADILVGDVWVGSGQSNMQMGGGDYVKNDPVLATNLAAGPYPQLRVIMSGKSWMESAPATLNGFSALLFSFGLPLQKELKIPVGLMVGAVGGTPSGFWLSQEAYESDQACKEVVAKYAKTYDYDAAMKRYEASLEKWKKDVEELKKKGEIKFPNEPQKPMKPGECRAEVGHLYQQHIHPYIPFAIKGLLWDQGESGTAIEGVDQYTLMGALIRGWRKEWGQDFPFIYVQKPSGGGCVWDVADPVTCKGDPFAQLPAAVPGDGLYRETHIRIMGYPNTFMVTSSDLGSGTHPVNKSGYGARAARVALGAVYGKPVEYYGPVYKSHKVDGGKVIVEFDHVGQGLAFRNGDRLQGFAVAGADGKFAWADAVIEGNSVVLSCDKVATPVRIRYAWTSAPTPWANLFNKDGLPALPFTTDSH